MSRTRHIIFREIVPWKVVLTPNSKSFLVGLAAFFLGVGADQLNKLIHGPLGVLDDFLLAIVAGVLVLWYERLRTRDLRRQLTIATNLNREVRQDLQTVAVAASVQADKKIGSIIRNAVDRIDSTLREVLDEVQRTSR